MWCLCMFVYGICVWAHECVTPKAQIFMQIVTVVANVNAGKLKTFPPLNDAETELSKQTITPESETAAGSSPGLLVRDRTGTGPRTSEPGAKPDSNV